jgi:hypothetical protein
LPEEVQAYTQERIEAFRLLDSLRNLAPKYNEKTNISLRKDPKMRVEAAVNAMYLTNTDSPDIENIANAAILYHDDLSTENIDHAVTQYSLSKGQFEDIRQFFDDLDFDETYMGVVDNAIEKLNFIDEYIKPLIDAAQKASHKRINQISADQLKDVEFEYHVSIAGRPKTRALKLHYEGLMAVLPRTIEIPDKIKPSLDLDNTLSILGYKN